MDSLMKYAAKAKHEIGWWYSTARKFIPRFGSKEFTRMVAEGVELAYEIAPSVNAVAVEPAETGYFIFGDNKIVLPSWYLSQDGLKALLGASVNEYEYVSLALVNGTLAHESLHCKYSQSPEFAIKLIRSIELRRGCLKQAFLLSLNVFEDLAIEAMARSSASGISRAISRIIDIKNGLLIPRETFLANLDKYLNDRSFNNLLSVIIGFKNRDNHVDIDKLDPRDAEIVRWFLNHRPVEDLSAVELFTRRVRVVFEFVIRHADEIEREYKENQSHENDSNGSSAVHALQTSKLAPQFVSEHEREGSKYDSPELASVIQNAMQMALEARREKESDCVRALEERLVEYDILDSRVSLLKPSPYPLSVSPNFGFVRSLLAARTRNETPGEPKNRGARIVNTRLQRIVTDGKIFGPYRTVDVLKPLEVIILVDMSGSTSCPVYVDGRHLGRLYEYETAFAKAFFKALKEAGITVSVFAHTSTFYHDTPALYHIASNTSTQLEERFERMRRILLGENYDGVVYKRIAKKFTRRPSRKLLVVLSDGEPEGVDYTGHAARMHTMNAIAQLRKQGIAVICLSVGGSKKVVARNNEIFGEAYNVDASKSLCAEFERVISEFANQN